MIIPGNFTKWFVLVSLPLVDLQSMSFGFAVFQITFKATESMKNFEGLIGVMKEEM